MKKSPDSSLKLTQKEIKLLDLYALSVDHVIAGMPGSDTFFQTADAKNAQQLMREKAEAKAYVDQAVDRRRSDATNKLFRALGGNEEYFPTSDDE